MNKSYLILLTVMSLTYSFGQINSVNRSNKENPKSKSVSSNTIFSNLSSQKLESIENEKHVGFGNHTCKTHELTEKYYQEKGILDAFNANYLESTSKVFVQPTMKTPGVNNISVIFHVVHNPNNTSENVSNALIMQVFNDIQEDFQLLNSNAANARSAYGFVPYDANINFCLATQTAAGVPLSEVGVIRVSTNEDWYNSDNGEENKMKASATGGSQIWDRNKYLNVWICDISNGASSGTAGYAYRPTASFLPSSSIDGIVLDYNLGMNNENVLTHEIGHYLGLDHTWGGSGSCSMDDGFTDTPNTAGPSFNYPGSCSGNQSTCSGVQTQYENYMDYSNCTVMFTQNQADYMLSILGGIRSSLLLSAGCNPVNAPPVADFTADISSPIIIPIGGSVNFFDLSTNVPTGWTWNFGGGAANQTIQNPLVTFNSLGTYTVTLTSSNSYGSDSEIKTGYVQVVAAASGTACDTLRNYLPLTEDAAYYNWLAPSWGYFPGTGKISSGTIPITQYADKFTAPVSTQVRRLRFPISKAVDNSGTGLIKIRVHTDLAGSPGTVQMTDTLLISDMNAGFINEFDFTTPVNVTGNFWITFEIFYGSPQDTVVLNCVNFNNRMASGINTMKCYYSGLWKLPSDLLGPTYKSSLWLDVLTSNGPAPTTNLSYSESEICAGGQIVVNGSGSTNSTNYYWYVTDDPYTTVISGSTTAGNTFTFPTPSLRRIYLFTDGSCMTDGVYLPAIVNTVPSAVVTHTNTTCGNNNGTITFSSPLGGDSPNYYYSIDGVNYQTTNTFSNLAAGTYTAHIATFGDNCESTYTVIINSSTAFNAGISANTSVCPSLPSIISATGGTSYTWYDGSNVISNSASTNVSPGNTTQYSCLVINGAGCQSTVYTTVTVLPLLDATFAFNDFCFGSANSATSIAESGGVFSFNPIPIDGATINSLTGEITNEVLGSSYTVQYAFSGACPSSHLETVFVNSNDDPSFVASNWCVGNVQTVNGIVTPGGMFMLNPWPADGASINMGTGIISNPVVGNSYTIEYTTPIGVCQASTTVTVSYGAAILVGAGLDQTICQGSMVTLSGSGASTYTWSPSVINGTPFNPPLGLTTYTVTGTLNGCSDTDVVDVTVNASPTINAGVDQVLCNDGSQVTLSASGNALSYSWDNGITDNVGFFPTLGTTVYTLTGIGAGCNSTDQVSVTVNAIPSVNAGNDQIVCDGISITLSGSGASSYSWSPSAIDGTPFNPPLGLTSYTVTGTLNGCTNSDIVDITVNALPTLTLANFPTVCANWDPFLLTGGSPGGGSYTGSNVNGSNIFDPISAGAGTTTITYTYTDINSCSNSITNNLVVDACLGVDEVENNFAVIYPNPAKNQFTIELSGDFTFELMDAQGRLVYKGKATDKVLVSVEDYQIGVYFVQIENNTFENSYRIIKQ